MDPADLIAKEEDDVSLPRAALNKLIKDAAPEARLTLEARELMLQISHEFIHKLAGQANLACNQASKKTIMADHILTGTDGVLILTFSLKSMFSMVKFYYYL